MKYDYYILGTFVNSTLDRWSEEDLCPQNFQMYSKKLNSGDELVIHMNSVGGDVYSGISIANMIKELNAKGVKTTCIVDGLAASIASVVACACQTIKMYESSFFMIHKCWSVVQGNSSDLRKEAELMDKIDEAIISFYHNHFSLEDSVLMTMLENETWISGKDSSSYCLNCEVIPESKQFKIAAQIRDFNNLPKDLLNMEIENIENKEVVENKEEVVVENKEVQPTQDEHKEEVIENKVDEPTQVETPIEKPVEDKVEEKVEEVEMITKAEADSRVSGMQSTMAKKIDSLKNEYESKINDFNNQLKLKDEELTRVQNEVTSLTQKLENSERELKNALSALDEKKEALDALNASVLTPSFNDEVDWHSLKGKEFLDYVKNHPEIQK